MTATSVLSWPLIALVRAYQVLLSPLLPPMCRYYPSCSAYALTSLRTFGPLRGSWLAARRLLRCHPWSAGGIDHVPDTWAERGSSDLALPRHADLGADGAADGRTDPS